MIKSKQKEQFPKVFVLYLDGEHGVIIGKIKYEVKLLFTTEIELGNLTKNTASEDFLQNLADLTENQNNINVIILGNNLGIGLKKAEYIAPEMREKTIVVWNDDPHGKPKEVEQYQALGYQHFSTRTDVINVVVEMLGLTMKERFRK